MTDPGSREESEIEREKKELEETLRRSKRKRKEYEGLKRCADTSSLWLSANSQNSNDFLKRAYRFLRNEEDDTDADSWEREVAKKYYDKLYKEYALADMSRYKEGKLGLRWRVEKEVLAGKGETICGNKACDSRDNLQSYEVPFRYKERGEMNMALVKLRVCASCANKLKYRYLREHDKKQDSEGSPHEEEAGRLGPLGEDTQEERKIRQSYEAFIRNAGLRLRLPRMTISVAIMYLHIFFARYSMGRIDQPGILAQALLYLACKSEETERYLRDIITVEHAILYPGHVLHLNEEYSAIRNLIVMNEQLILRFLGFDLNVELPYLYMYNYLYSMKASRGLAGVATGILNDMFSTLLVIKYAPPELACGAIYFATKLLSSRYFLPMEEEQELEHMIPELLRMDRSGVLMHQWFLTLDVTLESVLEISERLIEMYSWPYYGISDTFKRKKEEGELN